MAQPVLPCEGAECTGINQVIDLDAFSPERDMGDDSRLLCPVIALRTYVERTLPLQKTSQIFVCFGQTRLGQPASNQRLSHWLVAALALLRPGLHCGGTPSARYAGLQRDLRQAPSPAFIG